MKLSVAMCTYNGAEYIRDQLDSILSQTVPVNEIVICDDNSKDNTVEIAEEYKAEFKDIQWTISKNVPGLGVTSNFEKAISLCTGDIIFTADQDDVWYKNKVSLMVQAFEADPQAVLVFSNADVTELNTEKVYGQFWRTIPFSQSQLEKFYSGEYYEVLCKQNVVTGAMMAIKRDFALSCMPFPKNGLLHDDWLAICAPVYGKIIPIEERLIAYRQHGNNEVGAGLFKHAVRWLKNLKKRKPWAHAVERSVNFYERYEKQFTVEQKKKFHSWYEFNKKRDRLDRDGRFKAIIFLLRNLFNGNYRRYICPFYAVWVQDLLYVIFK